MEQTFTVDRVAIHLVDRKLPAPRFSSRAVDLDSYSPDDREALNRFFDGHLSRAWTAEEGARTRAAQLHEDSRVGAHFEALKGDPASFFERSRKMAQHLHDLARRKNTSPGLLMVLGFRRHGDRRRFLGLFKMDPGRTDAVTLREDATGQLLLELSVEHIDHALPDPEAGVLKWAILPHPTRPSFDVKVKDQEGPADLARYFTDFLGCRPRRTEKQQLQVVLHLLEAYGREAHPDEDWKAAKDAVVQDLARTPHVTSETVQEALAHSGLEGVQTDRFRDMLREEDAEDLDFDGTELTGYKVRWELSNDVVIEAPWGAQDLVRVRELDGEVEFCVRAAGYEKKYA